VRSPRLLPADLDLTAFLGLELHEPLVAALARGQQVQRQGAGDGLRWLGVVVLDADGVVHEAKPDTLGASVQEELLRGRPG
jgi:hypothetical protein